MGIRHYDGWESGERPEIAAHSLAKHRILREYVERYIHVLTARHGMERLALTLVDGFAGGGEYTDARARVTRPGSPQILIDAVRAGEQAVNASRTKPLKIDARFVFVEKNPAVARFLLEVLRTRGDAPRDDGLIRLLVGEFESHVDAIISDIMSRGRAHRAIFVLDQYGYTGVPVATIARIFKRLPNAEVFLTLAVGWITAYLPNAQMAAQKLGLPHEVIAEILAAEADYFNVGDSERRPDLLTVQRILHSGFTPEAGARFYTPFFIVSRESNRPYWFLHLANAVRANDVVKGLHWEVENHFEHFGGAGLTMLGYDPLADPDYTSQLGFQFDNAARRRTLAALGRDLPGRIASRPGGLSFHQLHEAVCNETPATSELLAESVRALVEAGELANQGCDGERRRPSTLPEPGDLISIPRQGRLRF